MDDSTLSQMLCCLDLVADLHLTYSLFLNTQVLSTCAQLFWKTLLFPVHFGLLSTGKMCFRSLKTELLLIGLCVEREKEFLPCNIRVCAFHFLCLMSDCAPCLCCSHGAIFCSGGGSQNTVAFNIAFPCLHATHKYCLSDRVCFVSRCYSFNTQIPRTKFCTRPSCTSGRWDMSAQRCRGHLSML